MTYEEQAALMVDLTFRNRIKTSILHFATYIMNEDPGVDAHNTRFKWAAASMMNPDMVAAQMQPNVVMDQQVQADGAAITDPLLQTAVELTVKKLM